MVNYRRNRIPGGTYFFTVTLKDRKSSLLIEHIDSLRQSFKYTQTKYPFSVDAIVILPDHIHAIWTLPENDNDYPRRWQATKSKFTQSIRKEGVPLSKNQKGEYTLWQRRYWEHTIRDEKDRSQHTDYIHFNPVKHGLTKQVKDWPYSSFHSYVKKGILENNWAEVVEENIACFGE